MSETKPIDTLQANLFANSSRNIIIICPDAAAREPALVALRKSGAAVAAADFICGFYLWHIKLQRAAGSSQRRDFWRLHVRLPRPLLLALTSVARYLGLWALAGLPAARSSLNVLLCLQA